jgi:hypothetical protein
MTTGLHERLVRLQEQLEDAVNYYARLNPATESNSRSAARREYLKSAARYGRFVARHIKGRVKA